VEEKRRLRLPPGKIPVTLLEEVVFRNLGIERKEVALGPAAGRDGSVINVGERSLIVSMDPITGAVERIGWLAVNINANDIATFGVPPSIFLSCILLPEKAEPSTVKTICEQMDKAAKDLDIAIVGGHCEVTPGFLNPSVVGCAMGSTEKDNYVTSAGARSGDKIILTKSAGIEGTAILASDKEEQLRMEVEPPVLENAKKHFSQISVVKDALTAFNTGGVNAMHDPTEGGILGGIHELADASNIGVTIFEEKIPIRPETLHICRFFKIDPLQLISSGALLISAIPGSAEDIIQDLHKQRIPGTVVGEASSEPKKRKLVKRTGVAVRLPRPTSDHLWIALKH